VSQLTLDGREVPAEGLRTRKGQHPLTAPQRAVLAYLRDHDSIRCVDAGVILYEFTEPTERAREMRRKYASADGLELLKRLEKRGLVRRKSRGVWVSSGT